MIPDFHTIEIDGPGNMSIDVEKKKLKTQQHLTSSKDIMFMYNVVKKRNENHTKIYEINFIIIKFVYLIIF